MPSARFPFVATNPALAEASLLPMLPFILARDERTISATGLLDTGATVNVLPY
jgi:hypothetical protein